MAVDSQLKWPQLGDGSRWWERSHLHRGELGFLRPGRDGPDGSVPRRPSSATCPGCHPPEGPMGRRATASTCCLRLPLGNDAQRNAARPSRRGATPSSGDRQLLPMAREARTSHRRHRSPPSASSEKFLSGLARQVPAVRAWTAAGSLEPSVLGLAGEARRPQEGTGAASAEERGWAHPRAKRGLGRETQDVRAAEEPRR